MEMSGELHAPTALPLDKEPLVPQELVWIWWQRENSINI
jgi:hypothetical protein